MRPYNDLITYAKTNAYPYTIEVKHKNATIIPAIAILLTPNKNLILFYSQLTRTKGTMLIERHTGITKLCSQKELSYLKKYKDLTYIENIILQMQEELFQYDNQAP
jgi:hypothetical protein